VSRDLARMRGRVALVGAAESDEMGKLPHKSALALHAEAKQVLAQHESRRAAPRAVPRASPASKLNGDAPESADVSAETMQNRVPPAAR